MVTQTTRTADDAAGDCKGERKPWAAPRLIYSVINPDTQKTSTGFGFETHSPGSLNGS